jgi:DUF2971 family protein
MKLYKFRSVNTNNLAALASRQLWFSSQYDFNDPFEGACIKDNYVPQEMLSTFACKSKEEVGAQKYSEMLSELGLEEEGLTNESLFQKMAEHDLDALIKIVHDSKIVCLSMESNENNPIENNLMWSHYADGLRGFCLVFDNEFLQKDINESSNKSMRPIKVEYKDIPNTLKLEDLIRSDVMLGNDDTNFIESVTETIATKSLDWKYENEMRIMSLSKDGFHMYRESTLKEIILGEKMLVSQAKLVIDTVLANHPNITIKEARLIPDSYKITVVPHENI